MEVFLQHANFILPKTHSNILQFPQHNVCSYRWEPSIIYQDHFHAVYNIEFFSILEDSRWLFLVWLWLIQFWTYFAFRKLWCIKMLFHPWKNWLIYTEEDRCWKFYYDSHDLWCILRICEYMCWELINENHKMVLEIYLAEFIIYKNFLSLVLNINSDNSFKIIEKAWEFILRFDSVSFTVWNIFCFTQFFLWWVFDGHTILLVHIVDQVRK